MKIQLKYIVFFLFSLMVCLVTFSSCETDSWAAHYNNKINRSDSTLWDAIKSNSQLTKFAWVLRKTGYDAVLSHSQMYTVWASTNDALNALDTTVTNPNTLKLKKELIENQITRASYSASGTNTTNITLLNKKVIPFQGLGTNFTFGNTKLLKTNAVCSNGVLHIIDGEVHFFNNIIETIASDHNFDSISNFIHSYDRVFFDAGKSIQGGSNSEGQITYIDSVKINYNLLFGAKYVPNLPRIGILDSEDSTYSVLLPTNKAWNTSYTTIKDYFRFYTSPATKINADTLQRKYTTISLIKDLSFSKKTMQTAAHPDSLLSVNGNVFLNPFDGAFAPFDASNGKVYVTDEIKYNSVDSWNFRILAQAEWGLGRTVTGSSLYTRYYSGVNNANFSVSGRGYIELIPSSSSINPTVTFQIPNTLSGKLNTDSTALYGARYNIYCVFLPTSLTSTTVKPNKVSFSLTYQNTDGRLLTTNYTNNSNFYITNSDAITKVLVAKSVTFPCSEYGMLTPNVKFKVKSEVLSKETTTYSRNLLIDCIILEPVR